MTKPGFKEDKLIAGVKDVLIHLQRVRKLSKSDPNRFWFERAVYDLETSTLELLKQLKVDRSLKNMIREVSEPSGRGPISDPDSSPKEAESH